MEKQLEQQLRKTVEDMGGLCWKLICPGTTGVPDRICLRDGRAVFVEVKTPGRKPRPIQEHRMKQLQNQGFTTFVIDSADGIREVCDALSAA
ncbi:VRR-NUC domain-containing protein [Gleimia hominis]|uniref:VRR-NUC domain-containing protein n=1 Tax=Gleimia hominis TaxID=595468 RepID=A0ABU3ICV7_9ACTO|nr:VRR-NUC domain-containing protein [Gleimia hominis]MDT3768204.1 VRR-NUC domain-containing protein [Gleimia hominis]MDT3768205.1 VRR-NUC domain-containing protein [Gleimia hominis]